MKRILFSLIMIAVTVGIVTASAYALFSDTANVQGVTINSGNADLKINGDQSFTASSWFTDSVYPGWIGGQKFYLGNSSSSNISLDLTAKLTSASGNWGELKDKINVALVEYGSSSDADAAIAAKNPGLAATANTGWVSFSDWNSSARAIGTKLEKNKTHYFVFWGTIANTVGNDISGKSVNSNWVITGNQSQ